MNLSSIQVEDRTIYFREGTSDTTILNANLYAGQENWKPEYMFPELPVQPDVIFDIGANIGITAILLSKKYPFSTIYSFEPEAENYSILLKNVEGIDRIKTFNFGLSNRDAKAALMKSAMEGNFGGYTMFDKGAGEIHQEIEIRAISDFMQSQGIEKIDLIKIDCEGAEYDILTSLDLTDVTWIEGECHGINDWKLLEYISKSHVLGLGKPLGQRNFNFHAFNKVYAPVNST